MVTLDYFSNVSWLFIPGIQDGVAMKVHCYMIPVNTSIFKFDCKHLVSLAPPREIVRLEGNSEVLEVHVLGRDCC